MKTRLQLGTALSLMVCATAAMGSSDYTEWQLNRLFHPTPKQVAQERDGHIFIYDGLTEKHVQAALDQQFGRVGSMMFVRVIETDEDGTPKTNPETGEVQTKDDGC